MRRFKSFISKKYEKNHIKYDLVIRARPDLDFNQPLNDGVISQIMESKNRVAVPSFGWENKAISDAFAYGCQVMECS